jgi:amino acid transporter/nucleotide-binding universal stress UspA family protein
MVTETQTSHTKLAKELGLKEALAIAIGAMIGGGIFTALGRVALLAGPLAVISFAIGGLISLLTAHSYVKLVSKYPSAGGEFVILRRGFKNPLFGNFIGILLWLGYSVTIALYASTFGAYVSEWFHQIITIPFFDPNTSDLISFRQLMSATAIFVFMGINLRGVKETGFIQNIIVSFKLFVLLLLAFVGLFFIQPERYLSSMQTVTNDATGINLALSLFSGIFVGGAIIFVSYEGFQVIANTVEELKDPSRIVPFGMYASVIIVTLTYMSVTFVAIGLIDGEITETALIQAVEFLGPVAVTLITLGAIASTTSAINATLLGSSRLAYVMSDWQAFPKKLATISKKSKVPYLSIIITSVISFSFTALGSGGVIAEVGSIIFLVIFFAINYSVIKIYKDESTLVSKLAVGLILLNLLLAIYFALFISEEDQSFAFVILGIFSLITISWVVINHIVNKDARSYKAKGYELKPLGADMIEEFRYEETADTFFIDLENMLVTISGEPYETTSIQITAYLAKKYGVSVTLLHILKNEDSKTKSETKLENSLKLLKDFNVSYNLIFKVSSNISQAIIDIYREGNYQLIIMASKRKSGLYDRLFVKSISKVVVNAVDCTVLQIHPRKYGVKNPEIGDLFVLMDGTSRDEYILRWAQLISSSGIPSKIRGYHVLELPGIFPLDEAVKIPAVTRSSLIFDDYITKLGKRYNIAIKPVFMVGHSFVKAMKGEVEKYEPDAIIIGHSKDKGFRNRIRSVKSYKLMKQVSSAVIVHHMPELEKIKKKSNE